MNNIVIRSLPEGDEMVSERKVHDVDSVRDIICVIEPNVSWDLTDAKRLGKSGDRPRLLRVSLPSANCKQLLLREAK